MGISQRAFETPWAVASFEAEFCKDHSYTYICTKHTKSGQAQSVGYLIVWSVQDEGEIVVLAVDTGWRNMGIASSLLQFAFDVHDVSAWHLEANAANAAAIALYEQHGFKKTRMLKNYYGQGKDAIQMSRVK
jgi:ribosomal-protein-alanine N-acetyltransferase